MMSLASPDAGPRGIEPPLAGPKALRLEATLLLMSVFGGTVISACNEAISTTETQSSVSAPADEGDISSSEPSPTATATEALAVVPTPELINEWSEAGQGVLAVDGWDGTQGRLRVGDQENLGTVSQENESFMITVETTAGVEVTGDLSNMWTEHENPYNQSQAEPISSFVGRDEEGNVVLLENVDGQWQELPMSSEGLFDLNGQLVTNQNSTIRQLDKLLQEEYTDHGYYTQQELEGNSVSEIFIGYNQYSNSIRYNVSSGGYFGLPGLVLTRVSHMPVEGPGFTGEVPVFQFAVLDQSGDVVGSLYGHSDNPEEFLIKLYEGIQDGGIVIFTNSEYISVSDLSPAEKAIYRKNLAQLPEGTTLFDLFMQMRDGSLPEELQKLLLHRVIVE